MTIFIKLITYECVVAIFIFKDYYLCGAFENDVEKINKVIKYKGNRHKMYYKVFDWYRNYLFSIVTFMLEAVKALYTIYKFLAFS